MPIHKKESEKNLERKLVAEVKTLKGWAIKLLPFQVTGLPDRLCLLPGGKAYFVEMKSEGKKPTLMQTIIHKRLAELGFKVWVLDTTEKINNFIKEIA
jgi:hypothetical protein